MTHVRESDLCGGCGHLRGLHLGDTGECVTRSDGQLCGCHTFVEPTVEAIEAQHVRDLEFFADNADEYFEKWLAARNALARAAYVAEHLMQMIDPETWRATGGDDGQGHYEGDYSAEQLAGEIAGWKALAGGAAR